MESLFAKLTAVRERFQQIEELLALPEVATDYAQVQTLAKERASLEPMVTMHHEYLRLLKERDDVRAILQEGHDPEMSAMARGELGTLDAGLDRLSEDLKRAILRKDPNDDKDVIVEIREGVGGQEAGLFASDLYRMYTRYALLRNWEVELLDSSPSDLEGSKRWFSKSVATGPSAVSSSNGVPTASSECLRPRHRAASTPPPRPSRCCLRRMK